MKIERVPPLFGSSPKVPACKVVTSDGASLGTWRGELREEPSGAED